MDMLNRISSVLNKFLIVIGGVFFVAMILLTCANVLARQLFVPIRGTFELMGYSGAIVTAFALGYTQLTKGHIAVDVLVNTFSKKTRRFVDGFNTVACLIFFSLASWQIVKKALILKNANELSETLRIIYYPFTFAVALGCVVLALVFFTDLLKSVSPEKDVRK